MLTEQLKIDIKKHSTEVCPEEACGLILEKDSKLFIYPCSNISCYDKTTHFELNPIDYLKADKLGKIVAIFHSQINGRPSELDKINSWGHNIKSIIYSRTLDEFFEVEDSKLKQYIGLEFKIGTNDCFSLIKSYYKNIFNIDISDYKREDDWFEKNPKIFSDNSEKEGFITVRDLQIHDIILFNFTGRGVHHMAIYLGDNIILHHKRNCYSNIEYLTKSLKDKIGFIVRHKKFI